MGQVICVAIGGGLGSVARYLVNKAFVQRFPHGYSAVGTLAINVTGSFLIGFLMTLLAERFRLSPFWQLLIVTGFLGGYTTFSSFEYDGYLAMRAGQWLGAGIYLAGSVVVGFGAVCLGVLVGSRTHS